MRAPDHTRSNAETLDRMQTGEGRHVFSCLVPQRDGPPKTLMCLRSFLSHHGTTTFIHPQILTARKDANAAFLTAGKYVTGGFAAFIAYRFSQFQIIYLMSKLNALDKISTLRSPDSVLFQF